MAGVTDVIIENETNSKKFEFRGVSFFSNSKLQPANAVPFINQNPENNLLFRFVGQTEEFTFNFAIFNDSTDTSAGTSTVITVNDQITWLKNTIYTSNFDTTWLITQSRFAPVGDTVRGVITSLIFDNSTGGSEIVTGTLTFKVGKVSLLQ